MRNNDAPSKPKPRDEGDFSCIPIYSQTLRVIWEKGRDSISYSYYLQAGAPPAPPKTCLNGGGAFRKGREGHMQLQPGILGVLD